MNFIDIMTTIFEYENFATILTATTLGIFLLFILVLIAGLRDKKKKNEKPIELIKEELEEVTMEDLVRGILDEYEVEESVAREDIQEFLDNLVAGGILAKDE